MEEVWGKTRRGCQDHSQRDSVTVIVFQTSFFEVFRWVSSVSCVPFVTPVKTPATPRQNTSFSPDHQVGGLTPVVKQRAGINSSLECRCLHRRPPKRPLRCLCHVLRPYRQIVAYFMHRHGRCSCKVSECEVDGGKEKKDCFVPTRFRRMRCRFVEQSM